MVPGRARIVDAVAHGPAFARVRWVYATVLSLLVYLGCECKREEGLGISQTGERADQNGDCRWTRTLFFRMSDDTLRKKQTADRAVEEMLKEQPR